MVEKCEIASWYAGAGIINLPWWMNSQQASSYHGARIKCHYKSNNDNSFHVTAFQIYVFNLINLISCSQIKIDYQNLICDCANQLWRHSASSFKQMGAMPSKDQIQNIFWQQWVLVGTKSRCGGVVACITLV